MKILLTGASGQLGQAVQQQLAVTGYQLLAVGHRQLDITGSTAVSLLMETFRPDIVINCAAYTAVDKAEQQQALCFAVNAEAVALLAQQCLQHNSVLIHFSTDYVFDGNLNRPYTELDSPAPLNCYGKSKLAGEQLIQASGCRYLIIRTGWLFSNYGHNFLLTMQRLAAGRQQVRMVDDQVGGPTSAYQLAAAIMQLINLYQLQRKLPWGLYHYGGQPYVSWYQFAAAIFQQLGCPEYLTAISSQEYLSATARPQNSCLNSRHFCQTFDVQVADWQPELIRLLTVTDSSER
ncbi:dTDP-4-dehydrorhamnose reductase [Chromatiaceae bacterium AAb-1]|nr:dTDP-4-dehydrorhamnose reductase [Chromatiaceae bacterium AAb-1]